MQTSSVFKSTNGGASWQAFNTGLPDLAAYQLAIDPFNTTTLYAGIWSVGVFKLEMSLISKRPVVIIPGIMGTDLKCTDFFGDHTVWISNYKNVAGAWTFPLLLLGDGATPDTASRCETDQKG